MTGTMIETYWPIIRAVFAPSFSLIVVSPAEVGEYNSYLAHLAVEMIGLRFEQVINRAGSTYDRKRRVIFSRSRRFDKKSSPVCSPPKSIRQPIPARPCDQPVAIIEKHNGVDREV